MRGEIKTGRLPGAVVLAGEGGRVVYRGAFGWKAPPPGAQPLTEDTVFDLASLTKVVATTTAVMQLVEAGKLELDRPAADYWPAFAQGGKGAITIRQLLTHVSGLPPDLDLDAPWRGQDEGLDRAAAVKPTGPPGAKFVYSDINFIVLGEIVRRISGEPLDVYARRHIFEPLHMADTGFDPPKAELRRIAATDRQDGALRWGQVQDPTAFRMGGVAGHAGVFSTAQDLTKFVQMLLNGGELDGARILEPETVALMTAPEVLPGGVRRGLGWDMGSPYANGMDLAFGPMSFGHTGYTGCSLWIDPQSKSFLIILSSRLNPDDHGDARPLRRELAALVGPAARRQGAQVLLVNNGPSSTDRSGNGAGPP